MHHPRRRRRWSATIALALAVAAATDAGAQRHSVAPATPASATPRGPAATPALPAELIALLRSSGVPLKNFGISVRPVDASAPTMGLNAEEQFALASTTKIVTSLAALKLLGAAYQWRAEAYTTAPVQQGRTAGDLVIVGGSGGLTPAELGRWFGRMHDEGLRQVGGRIVLDRVSLLHDGQSGQAATTVAEAAPGGSPPDPRTYNLGASVVVVQPSKGELASVSLQPPMAGVAIVNEMLMGGNSTAVCGARVRWEPLTEASPGTLKLLVSGRWINDCGRQEVAFVKPPTAGATALAVNAPRSSTDAPSAAADSAAPPGSKAPLARAVSPSTMVASLWAESGGQLRGGVVETTRSRQSSVGGRADDAVPRDDRAWSSRTATSMPGVMREMNKTSNNVAARDLLLSMGPPGPMGQRAAQRRVATWLLGQGLADDDIRIDDGSGRSRLARGRPRALVQLLVNQWHAKDARVFVDSLPIAGVDGTLSRRMRGGAAAGRAFLKTGSLSDTRALAGYVAARSGKVYAVALLVSHAHAARATPVLDALVEWLAANG